MSRCATCEYPIPDDRERVGSRCPSCREPLYEPPRRIARPARDDEASCALHLGMESVGVCFRCGNYLCETCRTRWRGQILCVACLNKAMAQHESTPDLMQEQRRQAFVAIVCGGVAWLLALMALGSLSWFDSSEPRTGVVATFVVFLLVVGNVGLAAVGTGQAMAALRGGQTRVPALIGLVVSGSYAAVALGAAALVLWQQ